MHTDSTMNNDRHIAQWLFFCAFAIFIMIVLGGVTRLTESGLSIVEWKPVMGTLPPIGNLEWMQEFEKYKQFPEYQKVNKGMSLEDFKTIFYYEYSHRLLGRLIGIFFLLPFLFFWFTKRIKPGLGLPLLGLFILGGLQGALGWFMVKSGLVDNPRVSQYRLAAHLGLAVIIYAYMLWVAFGLLQQRAIATAAFSKRTLGLCLVLFLMILSGALVAGTRAGLAFPTWPLMGDSFVPPNLYATTPFWLAAFEDVTTIQFNHRIFAYVITAIIAWLSLSIWRHKPSKQVKIATSILCVTLITQVSLGIATLLNHVPVALAAKHQGVGVLLLTAALFLAHSVRVAKKNQ